MFFYPDAGKDRTLVVAEQNVQMTHEQYWKLRFPEAPSVYTFPRGYVIFNQIYWYEGLDHRKIDPEVLVPGSIEVAECLALPDCSPVFNGVILGELDTIWPFDEYVGRVRKYEPPDRYRFEHSHGATAEPGGH